MKLVNLTPHAITLCDGKGFIMAQIQASGQVARVETRAEKVGLVEVCGNLFEIVATSFGQVVDLPEPEKETTFIVSFPVLQACVGKRQDLVGPDTTPQSVVRDAEGKILGVKRFQTILS